MLSFLIRNRSGFNLYQALTLCRLIQNLQSKLQVTLFGKATADRKMPVLGACDLKIEIGKGSTKIRWQKIVFYVDWDTSVKSAGRVLQTLVEIKTGLEVGLLLLLLLLLS